MKVIKLLAREIEVLEEVDVCVVGGGTAGVSAAVCAARNGARTMLVERWPFCGGMSTAAIVNMWHVSDGRKQVIKGIVDELIRRLKDKDEKYGVIVMPNFPNSGDRVDKTHEFSPEIAKHVYDDILMDSGVIPLYYTSFSESVVKDNEIQAVIVETKQGRKAIKAKFFVDATGDGDVAYNAGVPCEYGRAGDGLVQGMTMMFQMKDIDREEAHKIPYLGERHREIIRKMNEDRQQGLIPDFGPIDFTYYSEGGFANMNPAGGNPLDNLELTRNTVKTRSNIFKYMEWYRKNVPGFERVTLAQSGFSIGIRESRRVRGQYVFSREDMFNEARFEDAIGHGFWCIDIHDPKGSGSTTWETHSEKFWLEPGHSYQMPFRMLVPEKISNLLVAGRCASATHEGTASIRLQSHCMVMGQAAGTALGLCILGGWEIGGLNIRLLRNRLLEQGAYIE